MLRLSIALGVLLLGIPCGAQDDPWLIAVDFQLLSGSKTELRKLSRELMEPAKRSAAYQILEKLKEAGAVQEVAAIKVTALPEREISAAQEEEIRFPTQFEFPQAVEPKEASTGKTPLKPETAIAFPPSVFESRKVGISVSMETQVSADGKELLCEIKPKRSWFLQWDEFESGRLPNNEKILVKQPRFAEASSVGTFAMTSDEPVLVGIHNVPGKDDQAEIMVLRLKTIPRVAR